MNRSRTGFLLQEVLHLIHIEKFFFCIFFVVFSFRVVRPKIWCVIIEFSLVKRTWSSESEHQILGLKNSMLKFLFFLQCLNLMTVCSKNTIPTRLAWELSATKIWSPVLIETCLNKHRNFCVGLEGQDTVRSIINVLVQNDDVCCCIRQANSS